MTKKSNGKSIPLIFKMLHQKFALRLPGTKVILTLACITLISVCLSGIGPSKAEAAVTYLFDRTVRWADGTTERIQIGSDGIFRLNGIAGRLMGANIETSSYATRYYYSSSLALIEKEVTYLQSKGVRTMQIVLPYEGPNGMEAARYKPVLDILYKHKMLVMPLFTLKYYYSFNNLVNPNIPLSGDSLSSLVARWSAVVRSYQNVVAIYVENELDYRVNGQTYGASAAGAYMKLLTGLFRQNVSLPLATKLVGYFPGGTMDQIKQAVLPYVNIPAFDIYQYDAARAGAMVDRIKSWLGGRGYSSTKWWASEFNAVDSRNAPAAGRLNATFLDAAFSRGVPLLQLWVSHRVQQPAAAFFDAYGNPIWSLVNLAPYISKIQGTIPEQQAVSKATPAITWNNPANISYGTPLGPAQLNATASVQGTFIYTPAAGTVLPPGYGQNLRVDFIPADTTNYNTVSKTVVINVTQTAVTAGITVTYPTASTVWTVGSTVTVNWTSAGITDYLNVMVSRDGGVTWSPIKFYTTNDGNEKWLVTGPATSNARVIVICVHNSKIYSLSPSFTIR